MKQPHFHVLGQTMPGWVWERWQLWMKQNPDHPRHRDQLACNIGSLVMIGAGVDVEPNDLMRASLDRPWRPTDDE